MSSLPKKQYGLILKKENAKLSTGSKVAAAFADDDTETVDTQIMTSKNVSASTMRVRMQAQRQHEKAVAEDPSVFEYDEIYEKLQAVKDAKQAEQKSADKERKPKYVGQILKAHQKRQAEQQLREERKQEKERAAEGDEFKDKETFVTGAYRKQMEEAQAVRKELEMQNRIDELTAVEKQKMWQAGFHRAILDDITRDDGTLPSTSNGTGKEKNGAVGGNDQSTSDYTEKVKSLRRRVASNEDDLLPAATEVKAAIKKEVKEASEVKKSIYSDESDEEAGPEPEEDKPDLKPGLNILSRPKKLTKAEQLRRRFTPSGSEGEGEVEQAKAGRTRRRSESSENRRRHRREEMSEKRRQRSRSHEKRERRRSRRSETPEDRNRKRRREDDRSPPRRRERTRSPKDGGKSKHRRDSRDEPRHREDKDRRKRSRSADKATRERHHKKEDEKHPEKSRDGLKKPDVVEDKKAAAKPKTKEERLVGLKRILKQRNTEEQIAEYRKRYLERKESGFVTLPL